MNCSIVTGEGTKQGVATLQQPKKEVKLELQQLKDLAQELEENIATQFVFDGSPLLMITKGAEGFNWLMKNASITSTTSDCHKPLYHQRTENQVQA